VPSAARYLAQYFVDLGLASWADDEGAPPSGWVITTGAMPPAPADFITVKVSPALNFPRNFRTGDRSPKPGVSIMIRCADDESGQDKGAELEAAMDAIGLWDGDARYKPPVQVEGGDAYALANAKVTVTTTQISREEDKHRAILILNARLTLEGPL
jgi:hypothetical protein